MRLPTLNHIFAFLHWLENFLFPPTCVVTNQPTKQIDLQPDLVASWSLGVYLCPKCSKPGINNQLCASCIKSPGLADKSLVAFAFKDDLRELIHQYKYQNQLYLSRLLAEAWLQEIIQNRANQLQNLQQIDALIPVPLHLSRLRQRGYNQALELARMLGKKLNIPVFNCLVRVKKTPSQTGLKANQRRKNLTNAFELDLAAVPELAKLQKVALIDDVITTGSTMHFAIACLKSAQPDLVVEAWAIAKT